LPFADQGIAGAIAFNLRTRALRGELV